MHGEEPCDECGIYHTPPYGHYLHKEVWERLKEAGLGIDDSLPIEVGIEELEMLREVKDPTELLAAYRALRDEGVERYLTSWGVIPDQA